MAQTTPSFFNYSSPFIQFCTQATCDIFFEHFKLYANLYGETLTTAIGTCVAGNYRDHDMIFSQKAIVNYALKYCQEYVNFSNAHPTVVNGNNNTIDNVYTTLNEIITNAKVDKFGSCHLKCIMDAMMVYCLTQCKYIFKQLLENVQIVSDDSNVDEKAVIEEYLRMLIKTGTAEIFNQFQCIYPSLSCAEDNSCECDSNFELQKLIQIKDAFESYDDCTCGQHLRKINFLFNSNAVTE